VQGDDAQQVTARHPEGVAVQPARHLHGTERLEPCALGREVVGLEVDVIAGLVVDRLDGGDQTRASWRLVN